MSLVFDEVPEVKAAADTGNPPAPAPLSSDIPTNIELHRSRRRSLSITVDRAVVKVRAPLRMSRRLIEEFIDEKRSWIEKQVQLQRRQLGEIYRISDGTELAVAEKPITLRVLHECPKTRKPITRARAALCGQTLQLKVPAGEPAQNRKRATELFLRWLTKQAAAHMTPLSQQLATQLGLQDRLATIRYRRTRSKWGHCTGEGDIQYNPVIMLAPAYVIEYIIAHEVAHLRHPNHSRSFWNTVDRCCPVRDQAERWLDEEGHRLAIEPGG